MSAFGTWRNQEKWLEHISHGFMYGFPQYLVDVVQTFQGTASRSAAVREAQRILNSSKQIAPGKTSRTYQQEFRKVKAW